MADWVRFVVHWLQEVVSRVWCQKKKEGGKSNRDPSPLSSQSVGVSVSRPVALNRATQLVTHFQPHSTHTLRFITTDTHTGLKI